MICKFPKGASFETITFKDVQNVQYKLNNRPRKRLVFFVTHWIFNAKIAKSKNCIYYLNSAKEKTMEIETLHLNDLHNEELFNSEPIW